MATLRVATRRDAFKRVKRPRATNGAQMNWTAVAANADARGAGKCMPATSSLFVRSLGHLFFQTDVGVRVKNRRDGFAGHLLFHEVNSGQKAKQSQPEPQNSAKRFRDASIPASN